MDDATKKESPDGVNQETHDEHEAAAEAEGSRISKEATLDEIKGWLEDLLSKQNLAEDAFIQQHMNAQMYIPVGVLASHRNLTSVGTGVDSRTLLAAAQLSDKLGVDEDGLMIRPVLKPKRNTLILHDLPDGTTEEDLRELFNALPGDESVCSLKPDVNKTAFVTFSTDEAAQNAALWLLSQKLHGAELKCAIKSEHFLRSFFPAASPQGHSPYLMPGQPMMMWGATPPWVATGAVHMQQWQALPSHAVAGAPTYDGSMDMWNDAWLHDSDGVDPNSAPQDIHGPNEKGGSKGTGQARCKGGSCAPEPDQAVLEAVQWADNGVEMTGMGTESFSPMQQDPSLNQNEENGSEFQELGYTHAFRQYSRQQIKEVCNKMDQIIKPESYMNLESGDHDVALFRPTPCKEWAPLPTPQISFASSIFAGEGKRNSEDHQREHSVERSGRPPRKASTSSWSKGSPSLSCESPEEEWTNSDGWNEQPAKWKRKSWGDWYAQQWVEKGQYADDRDKKEHWVPKASTSWVEKVKGKRPEEKDSMEVVDAVEKTADTVDISVSATGASESQGVEDPVCPAAEGPSSGDGNNAVPSSPTWADKVRQGTAGVK